MSAPTPRTDAEIFESHTWDGSGYDEGIFVSNGDAVPADFARTLERENAQLRADLAAANKQVEELQVKLGKERDALDAAMQQEGKQP